MSTLLAAAAGQGAGHRLQGAVAAVRAGGRLGDRADGRPVPVRFVRQRARAGAHGRRAAHRDRPDDLDLGARRPGPDPRGRARRSTRSSLGIVDALLRRRARDDRAVAALDRRRARPATASTTRCCSARSPAWSCSPRRESLMTLFIGFELLSIPLYVLCATAPAPAHLARGRAQVPRGRLGRVGHAPVRPGADLRRHRGDAASTGSPAAIAGDQVNAADPLLLTGIALAATGLAFKASVAPFHQWTPDVYQGAPTPITTFMAVATKAAAFAVFLRLFDQALGLVAARLGPGARRRSRPTTIVIGNVGRDRAALAQADARVVERGAGRLPARRRRGRAPSSASGPPPSTSPSTC